MALKFIVTGTGRCGTVFMARFLTSIGIPCGHECIFTPFGLQEAKTRLENANRRQLSHCSTNDVLTRKPIPSWVNVKEIVAESSYMSAPFLDDNILVKSKVIHVIRNPLKVISSFVFDGNFFLNNEPRNFPNVYNWEKFIFSHCPEIKTFDKPVDRAAFFVYTWLELIKSKCQNKKTYIYNVESKIPPELFDFVEKAMTNDYFNTKVNSWNSKNNTITWEDIAKSIRTKLKNSYFELRESNGR